MVYSLGERSAHDAGRGQRAIETRQRHHVEDGADAGIGVAEQEAERIVEFDFGRGVGTVADLVLQPLELQAVRRAIFQQARDEEAAHAFLRLRQHDEGVAHRRRHEPFVAGEAVDAFADLFGSRLVGAHVGAALLLRHAHADRHGRFLHGGLVGRIDTLRERIFGAQSFCTAGEAESAATRGAGHGQRAEMAGFELRRQIEACRPDLVRLILRIGIRLRIPDRGVKAR